MSTLHRGPALRGRRLECEALDRLLEDVRGQQFDVPTLVLHGEDDQIVPVRNSAVKSARLIKGAKEIYYPGAATA